MKIVRHFLAVILFAFVLSAGAIENSYVLIDGAKLFESPLCVQLAGMWKGDIPLIDTLKKECAKFDLKFDELQPVAILLPNFDEIENSLLLIHFPTPMEDAFMTAAKRKIELFSIKDKTTGKFICLNNRDEFSTNYVLSFSSPNLVWAGSEEMVVAGKLCFADSVGRDYPDPAARRNEIASFVISLPSGNQAMKLLGGANVVSGKLTIEDNETIHVVSSWRGGKPMETKHALEGFYGLGVAMFMAGEERGFVKEIQNLPKFSVSNGVLNVDVRIPVELSKKIMLALQRKLTENAFPAWGEGEEEEGW